MRNLLDRDVDQYRARIPIVLEMYGSFGDESCGAFVIPTKAGGAMFVIASASDRWDHVSASLPYRCPTWDEMSMLHRLFFKPTEYAMQLHVPVERHVNECATALHLWRPHDIGIPHPPVWMVGAKMEGGAVK